MMKSNRAVVRPGPAVDGALGVRHSGGLTDRLGVVACGPDRLAQTDGDQSLTRARPRRCGGGDTRRDVPAEGPDRPESDTRRRWLSVLRDERSKHRAVLEFIGRQRVSKERSAKGSVKINAVCVAGRFSRGS